MSMPCHDASLRHAASLFLTLFDAMMRCRHYALIRFSLMLPPPPEIFAAAPPGRGDDTSTV